MAKSLYNEHLSKHKDLSPKFSDKDCKYCRAIQDENDPTGEPAPKVRKKGEYEIQIKEIDGDKWKSSSRCSSVEEGLSILNKGAEPGMSYRIIRILWTGKQQTETKTVTKLVRE